LKGSHSILRELSSRSEFLMIPRVGLNSYVYGILIVYGLDGIVIVKTCLRRGK